MSKDQVTVNTIQHTSYEGKELISLEIELPRFIVAQMNTHKAISRNYQSSRAMPILKQMGQISKNPFMPLYYGSAQQGMVAGTELSGCRKTLSKGLIYGLSRISLACVWGMQKSGLSKEIANRYLEPWMITKGVVTATKGAWESFFILRSEHDAQPEIQELSNKIRVAIADSTPFELDDYEWHIPYCEYTRDESGAIRYLSGDSDSNINTVTELMELANDGGIDKESVVSALTANLTLAIQRGVVGAAQVSYRTLDLSFQKVQRVWKLLKFPEGGVYKEGEGNVHFSPAEHVAVAVPDMTEDEHKQYNGNFHNTGLAQYRKLLEVGHEGYVIESSVETMMEKANNAGEE